MSHGHSAGCVCYDCSGRQEMKRQSEHDSVGWENNGNGHGQGCSCWRCDGYRNKRHDDIERKYPRRW
jgi:hypothetical protein